MTGQAVIGALRADLILNTAQLGTSANEAMRTFDRLKGRMDGLSGAADKSGRAFNGSLKSGLGGAKASFSAINSEMEKLRSRFDPLSVATQKYEQELRDLKTAQITLGLSSEHVAAQQKRLAANFEFNKQAINGFGASAQQAGFHSTNLFFQLQDISTMMASGQSPFVLAMQQGPQVVGIFEQIKAGGGSMGASLLGAFRSLVSPMSLLTVGAIAGGAALFYWATGADDAGKEADKAKDPVDALNAAFDRHKASAETATTAISELRKQYGEYAEEVRRGAAEQAERDVFAALKDARPVIDGITAAGSEIVALSGRIDFMRERLASAQEQASLGLIGPDVAMQTQEAIDALQDNLEGLTSGLGVTSDQAVRFSELMAGVDAAVKSENMEAMAAAASEALAYIDSLPGGMSLATGAFGDAATRLRDLRDRLAESVTLTGRLDAAAPGAGWMSAAIGETNLLIGRLKVAHAQSWALKAQQQFNQGNMVYSGRGGDPRQFMDGAPKAFASTPDIDKLADKLLGLDSSGGGSSKLSDAQKALKKTAEEVKKLNEAFEEGETPIAKFRAELKKMDELKLKGLSDGAYAAGVAKLNEELGKSSRLGEVFDKLIDSAMGGGGNIFDVLEKDFKDTIGNMLKAAKNASLGKVLSGGGGLFAGLLNGGPGGAERGAGGGAGGGGAFGGALSALGGPVGIAVGIGSMLFGAAQKRREEEYRANVSRIQAENQQRETLADMEIQLMRLQGRELQAISAQRYRESNAMTDAQRVIAQQIWAQEDLNRVMGERTALEEELLHMQGNQAELDRRALEKLDPSNRALKEQIIALRDAESATSKLNQALGALSQQSFASALDFARARGRAAAGLRVVGGTSVATSTVASSVQAVTVDPVMASINATMVQVLNFLRSRDEDRALRVKVVP